MIQIARSVTPIKPSYLAPPFRMRALQRVLRDAADAALCGIESLANAMRPLQGRLEWKVVRTSPGQSRDSYRKWHASRFHWLSQFRRL